MKLRMIISDELMINENSSERFGLFHCKEGRIWMRISLGRLEIMLMEYECWRISNNSKAPFRRNIYSFTPVFEIVSVSLSSLATFSKLSFRTRTSSSWINSVFFSGTDEYRLGRYLMAVNAFR
jgi:hypothetical protein